MDITSCSKQFLEPFLDDSCQRNNLHSLWAVVADGGVVGGAGGQGFDGGVNGGVDGGVDGGASGQRGRWAL